MTTRRQDCLSPLFKREGVYTPFTPLVLLDFPCSLSSKEEKKTDTGERGENRKKCAVCVCVCVLLMPEPAEVCEKVERFSNDTNS